MKNFSRRLQRLERRFGSAEESRETRAMLARLEAARLRCGLQPISGERRAELRGMGLVEMLHASRRRVAEAHAKAKGIQILRGAEVPWSPVRQSYKEEEEES